MKDIFEEMNFMAAMEFIEEAEAEGHLTRVRRGCTFDSTAMSYDVLIPRFKGYAMTVKKGGQSAYRWDGDILMVEKEK